MKTFTEAMRHDYPLTPSSVVIDCGGFEGNFGMIMAEKYGCIVHVLEPVRQFYTEIVMRVMARAGGRVRNLVGVSNYGVAATNRDAIFHTAGDSSGEWTSGLPGTETVCLKAIADVLAQLAPHGCDLLKLNIEGAEFETIEAMLAQRLMPQVRDLQVQFHRGLVPNEEARYEAIAVGLSYTHELTYRHPWLWENWRRK